MTARPARVPWSAAGIAGVLMVASWLPATGALQLLAYALVPAVVAIALLTRRATLSRVGCALLLAMATVASVGLLAAGGAARPLNVVLAGITYAPVAIVCLRFRFDASAYQGLVRLIAYLTFVQVGIALVQLVQESGGLRFASMASGDAATGTLLDNSHLFVVKMWAHLIILAVAAVFRVARRAALAGTFAALLGVVLGSALMATVLGVVGVTAFTFLVPAKRIAPAYARRVRALRGGLVGLWVVGLAGMVLTQPANLRYVGNVLTRLPTMVADAAAGAGPGKVVGAVRGAGLLVENPKLLLLGTAPGQYSSRAALILSGGYLRSQPDGLPVSLSPYTRRDILPLWNRSVWSRQYQDGVMNQPFNSLQSLVTETGMLGLAVAALAYAWLWREALRTRPSDAETAAMRVSAMLMLCTAPLLLLTDNWLEYPHALVPLVLPALVAVNHRASSHTTGAATS